MVPVYVSLSQSIRQLLFCTQIATILERMCFFKLFYPKDIMLKEEGKVNAIPAGIALVGNTVVILGCW